MNLLLKSLKENCIKRDRMQKKAALVFGYNKFAEEIAKSVQEKYDEVIYFVQEEIQQNIQNATVELFDLSDDWSYLENNIDISRSIVFNAMEDEAVNIFLTISLRAHFEDLKIIALATNKENAHKLKMAGANRVIPIVETTADIIVDMLEKPIINEILHNLLYEDSGLKIAQIEVENPAMFDGEAVGEIDWSRYQGIIVLSVIHQDLSTEFIYSSKAKRKPLEKGDILIIVGYEEDIALFEKKVGSRKYVSWSDWSR